MGQLKDGYVFSSNRGLQMLYEHVFSFLFY